MKELRQTFVLNPMDILENYDEICVRFTRFKQNYDKCDQQICGSSLIVTVLAASPLLRLETHIHHPILTLSLARLDIKCTSLLSVICQSQKQTYIFRRLEFDC